MDLWNYLTTSLDQAKTFTSIFHAGFLIGYRHVYLPAYGLDQKLGEYSVQNASFALVKATLVIMPISRASSNRQSDEIPMFLV